MSSPVSLNIAQNLDSTNLIHHRKYDQVIEPPQRLVPLRRFEILNGGLNTEVYALLDLSKWSRSWFFEGHSSFQYDNSLMDQGLSYN